MNKRVMVMLGAALVGAALLTGARSIQQSQDERIGELESELQGLTKRVSKIEYVVIEALEDGVGRDIDNRKDGAPESAPNGRYMIVDSITISEFHEDHSEEIDRLTREVRSLEQTVFQHQQTLAQISGESTGSGMGGGSSRKNARYSAQQRIVSNYQRAFQNKEREIKHLEAAQNEQKQIIDGRAGDTIITLITKRDLSDQLSTVSVGQYVTWSGKRIKMNHGSETWEVTRVSEIEE